MLMIFTIILLMFTVITYTHLESLTKPWFLPLLSVFLSVVFGWSTMTLSMGKPDAINLLCIEPI